MIDSLLGIANLVATNMTSQCMYITEMLEWSKVLRR